MARVRCITMQKNETKLLEPWIKYYGYFFGFENLYILDNGSNENVVFEVLEKYKKAGVNVYYEYNKKEDFDKKGDIISDIIHGWDSNNEPYDYVIPIDCDEFVVLCEEKIEVSREKLNSYLDSLKGIQDAFIIKKLFLNIPDDAEFFTPAVVPKSMFARDTLGHLDHGFHHPKSSKSDETHVTNLGYMHLHNKQFSEVLQAAKEKLVYYIDTEDKNTLKEYTGPGLHLVEYFFMTEIEYKNKFINKASIFIPEFSFLLEALGVELYSVFGNHQKYKKTLLQTHKGMLIRYPDTNKISYDFIDFNEKEYILNHEDLQNAPIEPLIHFSEYGYKESRKVNKIFSCSIKEFNEIYKENSPLKPGSINKNKYEALCFSKIHNND